MGKEYLQIVLKGMVMGAADIVPGVSGGTMAFVMGIYERLITAISRINVQAWRLWRSQGGAGGVAVYGWWVFIGAFYRDFIECGEFVACDKGLLLHYPLHLWGFFFGLVAASVWALGREVGRFDVQIFALAGLGALSAWWITSSTGVADGGQGYGFLFIAGALAVCAMILPGISGAFILLLIGAYDVLLSAISTLDMKVLVVFALGAVCGLLSISRILKWLFSRYHALTVALLTGFIFGSLAKLWPWKVAGENVLPMAYVGEAHALAVLGLMILGAVVIVGFEKMRGKRAYR